MSILPQISSQKNILEYINQINGLFDPFSYSHTYLSYAERMEKICNLGYELIRSTLINQLEELDRQFRNAQERTLTYYVKQTRERTIITPVGPITYKRTEYVNKHTKESYCYVDRYLGLGKRERYDICVQALIAEAYADQNSMIKVGKLIGQRIYSAFSMDPNRILQSIPRQTVFNILKRFPKTKVPIETMDETPDTLYLIADELYVPLQKEKSKKNKVMVKHVVCFTGMENKGKKVKRMELLNKYYFTSTSPDIWEEVLDGLYTRYDFDKVKRIIVMGDGANWIKTALFKLSNSNTEVIYALDYFHLMKAINKITHSNPELNQILSSYIKNNDFKTFTEVVELIKLENPKYSEVIDTNLKYILNNRRYIKNLFKYKLSCPMEGQISHNLASYLKSVPKGYSLQHIVQYLQLRTLHLNNYDIVKTFIEARDHYDPQTNTSNIIPELDFSMFDPKPDGYFHPGGAFNAQMIYRIRSY